MLKSTKIIAILCLIASLARFALDSYLPSLPAISKYFGISDTEIQLTITLYLIGFSFSQLIYGPLSDRYGRKKIILLGLGIFAIGNIGCAIASSPQWLLLARFIAGAGAGACGVLNRAIASDCFKGAEFAKAWSYTTTTLVITLCIAPILGGYAQEIAGWRSNFMISTLAVIIVYGIIFKYLPETTYQFIEKPPLDIKKIIKNYYTILIFPSFLTGTLCYTLAFSGLIAYFQVSPLLFINHFEISPSEYGWYSLIIAGNYFIGGLIVNKFAERINIRYLLVLGTIIMIIGGLIMLTTQFMHYDNIMAVILPTAVYVIGARIVIPNAIASSMEKVRHLGGTSSALIGCIQMFGSSIISFLIANCNSTSPLLLALCFTILGFTAFFISFALLNQVMSLEKSEYSPPN